MSVCVFIVDDEPIARRHLARLSAEVEGTHVVGEAEDGISALKAMRDTLVDVLFVDVRMPGMSGLELVRQLQCLEKPPAIVFTTAFGSHAVDAFELGAVDYLLKPFGRVRFRKALERASRNYLAIDRAEALTRAAQALADPKGPLASILVRVGPRILHLPLELVERFQAEDDYVTAYAAGAEHLLSVRMAELERRLPSPPFTRLHRSHIINLNHLEAFVRQPDGRFEARLKSGAAIMASRARSQGLRHAAV